MMKHLLITSACIILIASFSACKEQSKQIQYAKTIDEQANAIEAAIRDNGNTIDDRNSNLIKEHWGLILDNINAYQAEDKQHPCNEPECQSAFRTGKAHLDSLKQLVRQAHHSPDLDLNQLFPLN